MGFEVERALGERYTGLAAMVDMVVRKSAHESSFITDEELRSLTRMLYSAKHGIAIVC